MHKDQYLSLCDRRISSNNLLWQTPSLAIAAQAFLLSASLGGQVQPINGLVLAALSFVVGLASIHLIIKHRHFEQWDAECLAKFETDNRSKGYELLHGPGAVPVRPPFARLKRLSAYKVWCWVLVSFCALAAYAVYNSAFRLPGVGGAVLSLQVFR